MESLSRLLFTFLLNALWQIALVAAVAWLACRVLRRSPASYLHALWVAALAAAVVLPLASLRTGRPVPAPRIVILAPTPESVSAAATTAPQPAAQTTQMDRTVAFTPRAGSVILGAYILFVFWRLIRLARMAAVTGRIRRGAVLLEPPPAMLEIWKRCLNAFSLSGVELRFAASAAGPLMTGCQRRIVILPESLLNEASPDVLVTAIGHEMAHIARYDFAWNIFHELVYLPVSFHPGAWTIRRAIAHSREMACDELVTRRLLEPAAYARSMMTIAAAMAGAPSPGYSLGVCDGDTLEHRIRRLLERRFTDAKRARLLLLAGLSALGVCAVIASGLALTARAQSAAQTEMNLAAEAYNHGDFKTAVAHFENAVKLEPSNVNAKLFLAHTLIQEMHAEKQSADGPLGAEALQHYTGALAIDTQNTVAMQGLMSLALERRQFDEARGWVVRLIQLAPGEKGTYYTAAVLDWMSVFPEFQRAKQAAGARPEDYFVPDASVRADLRNRFLPQIEDGLRNLQTALQIDPNYGDAMAYMNLLLRLKSGMAESAGDSTTLLAQADGWVGKALAAKRRAAQAPPLPEQLDPNGPPPGPSAVRLQFAAPPPPPPPPSPVATRLPASAVAPPRTRNTAEVPGTFWQVTGANDMPAGTLIRLLEDKGFRPLATQMREDNLVRVMVGPYNDPQSLERAKEALQAAGVQPIRTW